MKWLAVTWIFLMRSKWVERNGPPYIDLNRLDLVESQIVNTIEDKIENKNYKL